MDRRELLGALTGGLVTARAAAHDRYSIDIKLDTKFAEGAMEEANYLLEDLDLSAFPGVARDALYFSEHFGDAFLLDGERVTAGRTGDLTVYLKPSDQFLKFVLALRALKGHPGVRVAA